MNTPRFSISHPIYLASASPRRQRLLREAGIAFEQLTPIVDDAVCRHTTQPPNEWVVELAEWKAQHTAVYLREQQAIPTGTILTADTICVHDNQILGKPNTADEARDMLRSMRNTWHQTMTGVCLFDLARGKTHTFFDAARVRIGHISDDAIEQYLESDQWRGKAGGYNLIERQRAGWPIACEGDPTTVMGLPMQRLKALLPSDAEPAS